MTEIHNSFELLEACWKCLVLGIVQGLTEFLPISSTAHLKALPVLLGWQDPGVSVIASLQLGSIIAVITYFRTDLSTISSGISKAFIHNRWKDTSFKLALAIFVVHCQSFLWGCSLNYFGEVMKYRL